MSKIVIKNVIFVLLLAISNIICFSVADEYRSAYFIVNILFMNVAFVAVYSVDMLFNKKKDNYVNNVVMSIVAYSYLSLAIIFSILVIVLKASLIFSVIVQLIILLSFFTYFAIVYLFAERERKVFFSDKKKNIEKKSLIMDVESQIGKRNSEIDILLEEIADKIRYMPVQSNKFAAKTDAKIMAGVKLLCNEEMSDADYIETINAVKTLLDERKNILSLTD